MFQQAFIHGLLGSPTQQGLALFLKDDEPAQPGVHCSFQYFVLFLNNFEQLCSVNEWGLAAEYRFQKNLSIYPR